MSISVHASTWAARVPSRSTMTRGRRLAVRASSASTAVQIAARRITVQSRRRMTALASTLVVLTAERATTSRMPLWTTVRAYHIHALPSAREDTARRARWAASATLYASRRIPSHCLDARIVMRPTIVPLRLSMMARARLVAARPPQPASGSWANYDASATFNDGSCVAGRRQLSDGSVEEGAAVAEEEEEAEGRRLQVSQAIQGCMAPTATNFNPSAQLHLQSNCTFRVPGCMDSRDVAYAADANFDDGSCNVRGCMDPSAENYDSSATQNARNCRYRILGCKHHRAVNYVADATVDDGSCIFARPGCTQNVPNYRTINYDFRANLDDGSCILMVSGCTNPNSLNYVSDANSDDGSCIPATLGCMAPAAFNFNPAANRDDGRCYMMSPTPPPPGPPPSPPPLPPPMPPMPPPAPPLHRRRPHRLPATRAAKAAADHAAAARATGATARAAIAAGAAAAAAAACAVRALVELFGDSPTSRAEAAASCRAGFVSMGSHANLVPRPHPRHYSVNRRHLRGALLRRSDLREVGIWCGSGRLPPRSGNQLHHSQLGAQLLCNGSEDERERNNRSGRPRPQPATTANARPDTLTSARCASDAARHGWPGREPFGPAA